MRGKATFSNNNVQSTLSDHIRLDGAKDQEKVVAEIMHAEQSITDTMNETNEKERFIQAMELGLTTRIAAISTVPPHQQPSSSTKNPFLIEDIEQLERMQRQLSLKSDLEKQMAERQRRKREEKERERQWEKEQEERLSKEREKLRREWEAERAAQRAKVAGKDDVQVVEVVLEKKPARKSLSSSKKEDGIVQAVDTPLSSIQKDHMTIINTNQQEEPPQHAAEKPSSVTDEHSNITASRTQPSICCLQDKTSSSLPQPNQLTAQVQCQEKSSSSLEQKCSEILESIQKIIRTQSQLHGAPLSSTMLPQNMPVIIQPFILTPENLTSTTIARSLSAPAPQQHHSSWTPPEPYIPVRLPILYTTSELNRDESRPNTSYYDGVCRQSNMPLSVAQRQGHQKEQRTQRLSLWSGWKKASKKLRKLTVQKGSSGGDGEDGRWIQEEESCQSVP